MLHLRDVCALSVRTRATKARKDLAIARKDLAIARKDLEIAREKFANGCKLRLQPGVEHSPGNWWLQTTNSQV